MGVLGFSGRLMKGTTDSGNSYSIFNYTGYIFFGLFFLATTVLLNANEGSPLKLITSLLATIFLILGLYSVLVRPPRWAQPKWLRTLNDEKVQIALQSGKIITATDTFKNTNSDEAVSFNNESAATTMQEVVLNAGGTISHEEIMNILTERDALVDSTDSQYNPQTALVKVCEGRGVNSNTINLLDEGEARYLESIGLM